MYLIDTFAYPKVVAIHAAMALQGGVVECALSEEISHNILRLRE